MSIASEIARLQQAKADLKTAINNKGGNITTERIDQFASEVASLPSPKEEEEKIVTPDFSTGNHVIVPTTGRVLRQVTLTKPANLIPENIKKDVDICGVVGTLESGGVTGGYEVYVHQSGAGNYITMEVIFTNDYALYIGGFADYRPEIHYGDIYLKNVVWLRIYDYGVVWANSTGITEAQATNPEGYTLTEDVYITLRD